MKLENEDKQAIFEIVAGRYFTTQNWKWVNLKKDLNKIVRAFDELNEQLHPIPMSARTGMWKIWVKKSPYMQHLGGA